MYKYISKDNQFIKKSVNILVPKYYQMVPKYYLYNHVDRLILHYSMGAGKTIAAINTIKPYIMKNIEGELDKDILIDHEVFNNRCYIIGAWTTVQSMKIDIMKPEMGIIPPEIVKESCYEGNDEEKQKLKKQANKYIDNLIQISNYQKFFNFCFPKLITKRVNQNVPELLSSYNRGTLQVDKEFLESLRNSIIIVDEMQKMYNSQNMNSYGFAIGCVIKKSKEYNIKFEFLTGTMLNNSTSEIPIIMSILNQTHFIDIQDYLYDEDYKGLILTRLRNDKIPEVTNFFKDIFLYYDINDENKLKETISESEILLTCIQAELLNENKEFVHHHSLKFIPNINTMPVECQIGNYTTEEKIMNFYTVNPIGFQRKLCDATNMNLIMNDDPDEDEDNGYVSLHDFAFDESDIRLIKANNIYTGESLKYPQVKQYSAIGAEAFKLAFCNSMIKQKTVLYHDKIRANGIMQYAEIFKMNGYTEYGGNQNSYARCMICGKIINEHLKITDHIFKALHYALITGDISAAQRSELVRIYNSQNNLYGEIISCLFISKVASSGVSLKNTNNMIILSRVSSLSLWRQIKARIIRTNSHELLPDKFHFANIYTMVLSNEQEYYITRSRLYKDTIDVTKKISNTSVTDLLFNHPEDFKTNDSDKEMINRDIEHEIENIYASRAIDFAKEDIIRFDSYAKLIQKYSKYISSLDFSQFELDKIKAILLRIDDKLELFERDKVVYLYNTSVSRFVVLRKTYDVQQIVLSYEELAQFSNTESEIGRKLLEAAYEETQPNKIRDKISKFMRNYIDYKQMYINDERFWKLIFTIHDEYYKDDAVNFIKNHANRDDKKIAGFYYKSKVILKNGEEINTSVIKPSTYTIANLKYAFTINSYNKSDTALWYLRVFIFTEGITKLKKNVDKTDNAIQCTVFPEINQVKKIFDSTLNIKSFCVLLVSEVCKLGLKYKEEFKISTPWTKASNYGTEK